MKTKSETKQGTSNKTYTSTKGIALELVPVSQFKLDSLRTSKEEIPIPVYIAENAAQEKQEFPLDADIAKHKGRLDEWDDYVSRKKKADAEYSKLFTELVIFEGVSIEVPGPDSEWERSCKRFNIKIPTEEVDRKIFYISSEMLGTPADIGDLVSQILSVSQIDEEAVAKLRDSFRAGIQRKTNKPMSKD